MYSNYIDLSLIDLLADYCKYVDRQTNQGHAWTSDLSCNDFENGA